MVFAGIRIVDTRLVNDAIELARSSSPPYMFNHAMRSWLFGVVLAVLRGCALRQSWLLSHRDIKDC
jgi:hypothetical protein